MSTASTLAPIKFRPVPRLLDHIGLAMYSNFNKAIAELVVNGYDADATQVAVEITANQIVIQDNGSGMSEDDIRNSYMMLGSDQKRSIKRTPRFNRLPIGNKGIGKLAGLGIARKISVTTTKDRLTLSYDIDRDELEKSRTIEDSRHDLRVIDNDENGTRSSTTILLSKIMPHVKIDVPQLRGYLAREIPQDRNFQITVNGEKCLRKDIPAKRTISVNVADEVCGRVVGEIIVAKKVLTNIAPGILTTVRGRVVGEPSLFDLNSGPHKYHYGFLLTGQVEVPSFDPEDEVDLIPVIATDREGFNRNHPKYRAYHKLMTDLLVRICREEEKEAESKRQKEVEAKVQEAIKRVADDFNAFNKAKKQETSNVDAPTAQPSDSGAKKISAKADEEFHETRRPDQKHRTNPVGITDKRLRKELDALPGIGHIHLGSKRYKITMKPLGVDDFECRIDDEKLIININVSHPAYEQAVEEKSVEITVFRAIGSTFAWKESTTSEEMYHTLDELIRFQAFRLATRRLRHRSE